MLSYPNLSFDIWKALDDPGARIERVIQDRSNRLVMGASISSDMRTFQCVLAMTSGHGKFVRLRHVAGDQFEIPEALRKQWQSICEEKRTQDVRQFMSEMADFQSQTIDNVKRQAGKYVDRILAVTLVDPGFWVEDFDNQKIYCPMSDSHQVADLTGLTVIDSLPANDLLAGGNGGPLEALPLWLTFADRHQDVAKEHRMVIIVNQTCSVWLLPASDGLDADLPPIQLISSATTDDQVTLERIGKDISDRCRLIERQTGISNARPIGKTLIFCAAQQKAWAEKLSKILPVSSLELLSDDADGDAGNIRCQTLDGAMTAMLGVLHIDQLQANIPWLTSATEQRVLGRLTPGTPSNWRQLVREMADFRPPAMKLKDAV